MRGKKPIKQYVTANSFEVFFLICSFSDVWGGGVFGLKNYNE